MAKWIVLLVLAAAGGLVYRRYFYESPAYLTYVSFEEAAADGNCEALYALVEGDAKAWVDDYCTAGGGMKIMGQSTGTRSAASLVADLKGSPAGAELRTLHEPQSEESRDDGSVDLVVVEKQSHPKVYQNSNSERHDVKLKKVGEAWKIVAYKAQEMK